MNQDRRSMAVSDDETIKLEKFGLDMNQAEFGRLLKLNRKRKKLSQLMLSEKSGVSKNYISGLERGVSNCTVKTFFALCNGLEITPDMFLQLSKEIDSELASILLEMDKGEQEDIKNMITNFYIPIMTKNSDKSLKQIGITKK